MQGLPNPLAAYRRWRERRAYDWWRREWYLLTADASMLTLTDGEIDLRLAYAAALIQSLGIKMEVAAQGLVEMGQAVARMANSAAGNDAGA